MDYFFSFIESIIYLIFLSIALDDLDLIFKNKRRSLIFVLLMIFFSTWMFIHIPKGPHAIIVMLFGVFLLSFTLKVPISTTFFCALSTMLLILIVETILSISFVYIGFSSKEIIYVKNINLLFGVLSKTTELLFAITLLKFRPKFFNLLNKSKKEKYVASFWLLNIFVVSVFLFTMNYAISTQSNTIFTIRRYELLTIILLFLFIALGSLEYFDKIELVKIENKYYLQELHIKDLQHIIDLIRREKHDFLNHLNLIYGLSFVKKPDSLDKINKYIESINPQLQASLKFFDSGNDFVDGLLAVKSSIAFNNNIKFDVSFDCKLDKINLKDSDLVSILGNLIDNAIEGIIKSNTKQSKMNIISLSSFEEDNYFYLSISNTNTYIPPNLIPLIFKKGVSTKKENKSDHGLGLFIVNKIIDENNGSIEVSSSSFETEFLIKFPIKN